VVGQHVHWWSAPVPAQTCFDGQRVILPELHRCSPTNGLLGGKDDGVTLNLSRTCQSPNPSRVLCIFGNTQINLLGLVISSATSHTLRVLITLSTRNFRLERELESEIVVLLVCWTACCLEKRCEKPDFPILSLTAHAHESHQSPFPRRLRLYDLLFRPSAAMVLW
jgi:hypothetical protein